MLGDEMIGIAVLVKRFSVSVNKACLKKILLEAISRK